MGGVWKELGFHGSSVFFAQFSCEPKTALKKKSINYFKNKHSYG